MLFHDTIAYNLHYGDLSADASKVEEVAKLADIHQSIQSWPNGYDTQVRLHLGYEVVLCKDACV